MKQKVVLLSYGKYLAGNLISIVIRLGIRIYCDLAME